MSHYKSNVRDQVFNLFEVFGLDKALGEGEYADLDAETAKEMLGEIARLAEGPIAESFADSDRNPPTFDPKTLTVTLPEPFKKSVRAMLDGGWDRVGLDEELGGVPAPKALHVGAARAHPRRQPGRVDVRRRRRFRQHHVSPRHRGAEEVGHDRRGARLGLHHGAHRAGRRFRRRRRPHQGRQAGRRLVAHRRCEALHHLG